MVNSCRKNNEFYAFKSSPKKKYIYINAYTAQSYLEMKLKIHEGVYLTMMKEPKEWKCKLTVIFLFKQSRSRLVCLAGIIQT